MVPLDPYHEVVVLVAGGEELVEVGALHHVGVGQGRGVVRVLAKVE